MEGPINKVKEGVDQTNAKELIEKGTQIAYGNCTLLSQEVRGVFIGKFDETVEPLTKLNACGIDALGVVCKNEMGTSIAEVVFNLLWVKIEAYMTTQGVPPVITDEVKNLGGETITKPILQPNFGRPVAGVMQYAMIEKAAQEVNFNATEAFKQFNTYRDELLNTLKCPVVIGIEQHIQAFCTAIGLGTGKVETDCDTLLRLSNTDVSAAAGAKIGKVAFILAMVAVLLPSLSSFCLK